MDQLIESGELERVMQLPVREALIRHKRLGESIVIMRDGKVVELPPDQIPID